ncbi:MAG: (2Fe-2S)-binding protein [Candidatus Riflebacteria bacterium]|nr:(2Fe-2S)-binding protein [Candidatus Riflebacteria bacterium]
MAAEEKIWVKFKLNGCQVGKQISPRRTLLEMLREDFALTAVKEGCGKGECGACGVLFNGYPINSCLKLAVTLCETDEILTLEGLAEDPLMKKIQNAYVNEGAVQCGFCTPGMLISSYSLLKRNPNPSEATIKESLSGNICRCTGYEKIVSAVKRAGEESD